MTAPTDLRAPDPSATRGPKVAKDDTYRCPDCGQRMPGYVPRGGRR